MDYERLTDEIIEGVGGADNVRTVAHCMTRLRFVLHDESKADKDGLAEVDGVLGVVQKMGQTQVVLGKNLLPVYEKCLSKYQLDSRGEVDEDTGAPVGSSSVNSEPENKNLGYYFNKFINFLGGSITPFVPALIAGGMIKVVLILIGMIWPGFLESQSHALLTMLSDAPFYFLPVFVAFGASRQLNSNPSYAIMVSLTLLEPGWFEMLEIGEAVSYFGVPVALVKYSHSLMPAILSTVAVAYLERFFNRIVPDLLKAVFVGALSVGVASFLSFTILGPLGYYIGSYLSQALLWMYGAIGPVAVAVLAGVMRFLIMGGMHTVLSPVMVQSLADNGFDGFIRPAFFLHNMAEGGACFAVALKTKNQDLRAEAISAGIGCIVAGISEPAIYGINLRLKRPIWGVVAGGVAGGVYAGFTGVRAYVMGYSNIFALPIFQDTVINMIIATLIAIVVAFLVTYALGFEDIPERKAKTVVA